MKRLIEFFVDRGIFVQLLTVLLLGWGLHAMGTARREAFPNINFDLATVTAVYPGASAEEVEKLITIPLEEGIKEVDGIKEYRSTSIENRSSIAVVIDPDVEDSRRVVDDIRAAVDRVEDLPDEIEKPQVVEVTSARQPVIELSMARTAAGSGALSLEEFRRIAREYERDLERSPGVARVVRRGWQDTEIHVNVDPDLLRKFEVGTEAITSALRQKNLNAPGGNIEEGPRETNVRTIGAFDRAEEVAAVFLRSNDIGRSLRVGDVAAVVEGVARPDIIEHAGGREALTFTVVKRQSADAIRVVDAAFTS